MGWSTNLFCNVSFNRKTYNSRYEVESELEQVNKIINTCVSSLRDLAIMTEPEKFYNKEEYNNALCFISDQLNNNIEILEEAYIDKYKLELLLDNWEMSHNKDGIAIDKPKEIKWDTAYVSGDFISTESYPKSNRYINDDTYDI